MKYPRGNENERVCIRSVYNVQSSMQGKAMDMTRQSCSGKKPSNRHDISFKLTEESHREIPLMTRIGKTRPYNCIQGNITRNRSASPISLRRYAQDTTSILFSRERTMGINSRGRKMRQSLSRFTNRLILCLITLQICYYGIMMNTDDNLNADAPYDTGESEHVQNLSLNSSSTFTYYIPRNASILNASISFGYDISFAWRAMPAGFEAIAGQGDVNGDGRDDVVAVAINSSRDSILTYYGSQEGFKTEPDNEVVLESPSDCG